MILFQLKLNNYKLLLSLLLLFFFSKVYIKITKYYTYDAPVVVLAVVVVEPNNPVLWGFVVVGVVVAVELNENPDVVGLLAVDPNKLLEGVVVTVGVVLNNPVEGAEVLAPNKLPVFAEVEAVLPKSPVVGVDVAGALNKPPVEGADVELAPNKPPVAGADVGVVAAPPNENPEGLVVVAELNVVVVAEEVPPNLNPEDWVFVWVLLFPKLHFNINIDNNNY